MTRRCSELVICASHHFAAWLSSQKKKKQWIFAYLTVTLVLTFLFLSCSLSLSSSGPKIHLFCSPTFGPSSSSWTVWTLLTRLCNHILYYNWEYTVQLIKKQIKPIVAIGEREEQVVVVDVKPKVDVGGGEGGGKGRCVGKVGDCE